MKKNLVFLLDEQEYAASMIRYAAPLAMDLGANLTVLHTQLPVTVGMHGSIGTSTVVDPGHLEKEKRSMQELVHGIVGTLDPKTRAVVEIEFHSEVGAAVEVLSTMVTEKRVDMILLQGQADKNYWVQKPVAMAIIREVECPVCIVEPDTTYKPLNKIVYASDLNKEDITAMQQLVRLTAPFAPEILAVHVTTDATFEERIKAEGFAEETRKQVGYENVHVTLLADQGYSYITDLLSNEAERLNAVMIAVLKENLNFFERIFHKSFTASLIETARLPVMVFRGS